MRIMIGMIVASLTSHAVEARMMPPADLPAHAASFAEHQTKCAGKEGWSDPAPPVRVFGDVYDIGTCGITVLMIVGNGGAIVIDGATAEAVPSILSNIARLGLAPTDVKLLLSTHEHLDHAGGLSELRRRTGAAMVETAASRDALESGVPAADDPQREGGRALFQGVHIDRLVRDGEVVQLGSLRLTAHATPGHAPGSTSWSWRSCAGSICHEVVYADSVSAVSSDRYRFSDHPAYVAAFRASLARIAGLPCDLIVTPHPAASDLYERLAGSMPLSAGTACANYAAAGRAKLEQRLASESTMAGGESPSAAPPPDGGTISIQARAATGEYDPATRTFSDAAAAALAARGFIILDDPGHAAYAVELILSRSEVGTGLAKVPAGSAAVLPGMAPGVGAGVTIPFSTGKSTLVALQRTLLDLRIRKRGEDVPLWHGAAVTVRTAGTPRGKDETVAAELSGAILGRYPAQPDDVVGVP